jgi:DNA-binding IscR family transcriptional regulator
MRKDSRLARMLHVLIHMHLRGGSTTSETIALMLHTNPVVVRRTMAGLRQHGYVLSEGGHRGGWTLTCALEDLTVMDVYRAVGEPLIFAIGLAEDHPTCPVETAVNGFLDGVLGDAETALLRRFAHCTLAEIARKVANSENALR